MNNYCKLPIFIVNIGVRFDLLMISSTGFAGLFLRTFFLEKPPYAYTFLLCLFFYTAPSLANDSIRIKITDEDSVGLHTCGVYVLATYIPYSCCFKRFRKLYDVYYLGIQDNHSVFRFDAKPESITHPYFTFQKGDEVSEIVEVREDGFISKIETRADVKSGKSRSYNLMVDYIDYKRKMAPAYINMASINEKTYIELTCVYDD